jgi:hypothetical protein
VGGDVCGMWCVAAAQRLPYVANMRACTVLSASSAAAMLLCCVTSIIGFVR